MKSKFVLCDRHTIYLMPHSIQDWLPEDHLARFVVEIVEKLDLKKLERKYSYNGRKAYPVQVMLGLLFYGYITGTYSSRKIEQATYDSVAFRFIAANIHPDHDTISNFRKEESSKMKCDTKFGILHNLLTKKRRCRYERIQANGFERKKRVESND